MNWLTRWRRLAARNILGINRRNAACILDLNPRRRYPFVDSKRKMHELCQQIGVPTPRLYAIIAAHSALHHLPRLLADRTDFVLKPDRGAAGRGILVISGRDNAKFVRSNEERLDLGALHQHLSSIVSGMYSLGGQPDAALIQERIVPDPVFASISYQGTPDVRVILYKDVPVMAMVRLPTKMSGGRANLHQGAVGAGIDLESGITIRAALKDRIIERHPDTGASVIGVQVPQWSRILEISRSVSQAVGLGYVGVDIILDCRRGPLLLEGNARPGLAIQIANGQGLIARIQEVEKALAKEGIRSSTAAESK